MQVPPDWKLAVNKVYILAYSRHDNNTEKQIKQLMAIDEVWFQCEFPHATSVIANAPEYNLQTDDLVSFLKRSENTEDDDLALQFKDFAMVSIKTNDPSLNRWVGAGFFFCNSENKDVKRKYNEAKQNLRHRLRREQVPMFARGALYHWALFSVAGLLQHDPPYQFKSGKLFVLQDAWRGFLKLTPERLESMTILAGKDKAALALIEQIKEIGGAFVDSQYMNSDYEKKDTPITTILKYATAMKQQLMIDQLAKAVNDKKVKQFKPFEQDMFKLPTIYNLYQKVNGILKQDRNDSVVHNVIFGSGPYCVGSSFIDRTFITRHPDRSLNI